MINIILLLCTSYKKCKRCSKYYYVYNFKNISNTGSFVVGWKVEDFFVVSKNSTQLLRFFRLGWAVSVYHAVIAILDGMYRGNSVDSEINT